MRARRPRSIVLPSRTTREHATTTRPRPRALLRRRTPAASAVTPACADSETLAAWIDGGLDAQAMAETELHLSDCARCQAMLAAIVRSEPDAPAVEPWWSRLHLRWLVPLTAAAAATVLWMVVPGARQDLRLVEPEATQARAERSDAAGAAVPAPGPSIGAAGTESSAGAATPPPASPAPAGKPAPARMGNDARTAAPSADQETDRSLGPGAPRRLGREPRARRSAGRAPGAGQAAARQTPSPDRTKVSPRP